MNCDNCGQRAGRPVEGNSLPPLPIERIRKTLCPLCRTQYIALRIVARWEEPADDQGDED